MKAFASSAHSSSGTGVLQRQRVSKRMKEKTGYPSLLLSVLFFLLIVSILCYVWTRIKVVQYGYEISSVLRAKEAAAIAHNERTIEIATLRSAQQVEKGLEKNWG